MKGRDARCRNARIKRKREREEREGQRGDKVKSKVAREQSKNSETFSCYTGDTLEMEQETRTCETEVMSDLVTVEEE